MPHHLRTGYRREDQVAREEHRIVGLREKLLRALRGDATFADLRDAGDGPWPQVMLRDKSGLHRVGQRIHDLVKDIATLGEHAVVGPRAALPHGAESSEGAVDVARDVLVHGLNEQRGGAVMIREHDMDMVRHRAEGVDLDRMLRLGVGEAVEDGLEQFLGGPQVVAPLGGVSGDQVGCELIVRKGLDHGAPGRAARIPVCNEHRQRPLHCRVLKMTVAGKRPEGYSS